MATNPICSVPNCGKTLYAKSLCRRHYERFRNHGDLLNPNETKPGDPQLFFETTVVTCTSAECLFWPFARVGRGYGHMWKDDRLVYVHRLACEAVHGHPPSKEHQAAHLCGRGHEGCVNPLHLSWKTSLANAADKYIHDTINHGERSGTAKLTDCEVRQIRALKGSKTQRQLASQFGVRRETISKIHRRETWTHI